MPVLQNTAATRMLNAYDIAYYAAVGATYPLWATRRKSREKVRDAFATRVGRTPRRAGSGAAVLVHAVSVGELNAARALVDEMQARRPGLHAIVTTTTTAGDALARERYAGRDDVTVLRFPLDLSAPIERLLDATRPALVVLMELEVWPNFLRHCEQRKIPVAVANGRVTEPSYKKYRLLGPVGRSMFRRLAACVVQDEVYAERFAGMGVPRERLTIAGTMKFDTAIVGDTVPGADDLARDVGLTGNEPVFLAASTGPGEEAIALDVYQRLLPTHPSLRLTIVPRKPERFDEVAELIASRGFGVVRRSTTAGGRQSLPPSAPQVPDAASRSDALQKAVVLGDTMGELRKFYALATVAFVGRSLVDLGAKQHGSDMIEPCALAKPTIVGPFTGNFEEPMRAFRAAGAIVEVTSDEELFVQTDRLLNDRDAAAALGAKAQQVVTAGKGSLARHLDVLLPLLAGAKSS